MSWLVTSDGWTILAVLVAILNFVLSISVTVHAVLWKRDSRAVIGWVGLVWLSPIIGAIAYWILGINRIQRKASSLNFQTTRSAGRRPTQTTDAAAQTREFLEQNHPTMIGLANAGRSLTGVGLVAGNRLEPLINGDEAFPAMLEAIDAAEHSVSLMTYIFDCDREGERFLRALTKAHRRGVEVRVLIDDVGSKYSRHNMVRRLKEAGVPAESFLPTRLPRNPRYANMRNHRKILVADGRIGFTGGTNVREDHTLGLHPSYPVKCLHFRVTGPVVSHLQHVFAVDWMGAHGEQLGGPRWFPELEEVGHVWARGIEHGPDENFEIITDLIAAALSAAQSRVRILTPYFLPDSSLIRSLNVTAMRGVDVRIYLPQINNIPLVHWAAAAQMWQVLEKGCRVFYTPPPFDHAKLMVVDDVWALIGSTNWDPRSLRLNFEFNLECYSLEFARQMNEIIDRKVVGAREISLHDVNGRTFPVRLRDGLARLMTPYL